MKKNINLLLMLLVASVANAQNILPNPNFILRTGCPYVYEIDSCQDWHKGTWGSTDYFNICAGPSNGIPLNPFGYENSPSGAYAGFYTYLIYSASWLSEYREYLANTFPALTVGAKYKVTVNVSLSDSSLYATDGLGVFFSVNHYNSTTTSNLHVTPQVDYNSYGAVGIKTGWVSLVDTFIADSAYKNLIIGNFKNDAATNLVLQSSHYTVHHSYADSVAYYYVDSVSVERIVSSEVIETPEIYSQVNVFPNPSAGQVVFSVGDCAGEPYTIQVFNMMGQPVLEHKGSITLTTTFNKGTLASGLYSYKVFTNTHVLGTGKLRID